MTAESHLKGKKKKVFSRIVHLSSDPEHPDTIFFIETRLHDDIRDAVKSCAGCYCHIEITKRCYP